MDAATLTRASRIGTQWFYWIAAFSLVNSFSAVFGGHLFFLTGLAVSQIVDVLAKHLGSVGPYLSLGLNLVIAFFFCGFGYLATQGSRAVFLLGIILYALDGLICLYFAFYILTAFHAFVLFGMLMGWQAQRKLASPEDRSTPPKLTAV